MVLDNIEQLLEKYDNGETTLQEEQELKHYFTQEDVAPHLELYKPMFNYFLHTHKEQFTKDVPLKSKKNKTLYQWISVAAAVVLMFGIYSQVNTPERITDLAQLSQEDRETYNKAKEVFGLVSSKFNKGSGNLSALNLMSANFSKGAENVNYIHQFSRTKKKFLKTKK